MKRFHVHVGVKDIDQSVQFYSTLFATQPAVRKPDYAKWMLDEPRVNFAISQGRGETGLHHLGLQVDDTAELGEVHERLKGAGGNILVEAATTCCYAKSSKNWTTDPAGIDWETFYTFGDATTYGGTGAAIAAATAPPRAESCGCGPAQAA